VMTKAQDEHELFDLYTRAGAPLGRSKARGRVHRDGDWHRSLHIWVWATVNGAPHLIFQRRSAGKDTYPGALDVAVTGHLRAGESVTETLREAEEEIGLRLGPGDVVRLGLRRREGVCDNELQDIFAAVAPVKMEALRPSPAEVEEVVAVPLAAAEEVLRDGAEAMGVMLVVEGDEARLVEALIRGWELVPSRDGYYQRAHASLAVMLSGGKAEAWEIG